MAGVVFARIWAGALQLAKLVKQAQVTQSLMAEAIGHGTNGICPAVR